MLYHLHLRSNGPGSLNRSAVLSLDSLCPPFNGSPNTNLFRHLFGLEFHCNGHTYVRVISPFEFTSCFGLTANLRHRLSHPDQWLALDAGILGLTSAWLLDHINSWLCLIRDTNSEIFLPRQYAAPATHIQAFVNGAIGSCLPDCQQWIQAYDSDHELSTVRDLICHPKKLSNAALRDVNFYYHSALHQGLIVI